MMYAMLHYYIYIVEIFKRYIFMINVLLNWTGNGLCIKNIIIPQESGNEYQKLRITCKTVRSYNIVGFYSVCIFPRNSIIVPQNLAIEVTFIL